MVRNSITPYIIEESKHFGVTQDIFSRLLKDRIIFIGEEISYEVANIVNAELLHLSSISDEPISIYLNTPGGSVIDGLSIIDTMRIVKPRIKTVCTGMAASMGSIILCSGDERLILPHSRVMIHQVSGGAVGTTADILIEAEEIKKFQAELYSILAERTHHTIEEITRDADRDHWFTAKEALEYGLVDKIL